MDKLILIVMAIFSLISILMGLNIYVPGKFENEDKKKEFLRKKGPMFLWGGLFLFVYNVYCIFFK